MTHVAKNDILQEGGLWRGQIHGIADSGDYLQVMKRRWRIILVWYNCIVVS
jgi:hypothetical protein